MQAPVYATVPVQRMGQVTMRDACRARAAATEAPPFSLAEVDRAFAHITQLRWRQTVNLPGALPLYSHVLRWFDVRRCMLQGCRTSLHVVYAFEHRAHRMCVTCINMGQRRMQGCLVLMLRNHSQQVHWKGSASRRSLPGG